MYGNKQLHELAESVKLGKTIAPLYKDRIIYNAKKYVGLQFYDLIIDKKGTVEFFRKY